MDGDRAPIDGRLGVLRLSRTGTPVNGPAGATAGRRGDTLGGVLLLGRNGLISGDDWEVSSLFLLRGVFGGDGAPLVTLAGGGGTALGFSGLAGVGPALVVVADIASCLFLVDGGWAIGEEEGFLFPVRIGGDVSRSSCGHEDGKVVTSIGVGPIRVVGRASGPEVRVLDETQASRYGVDDVALVVVVGNGPFVGGRLAVIAP